MKKILFTVFILLLPTTAFGSVTVPFSATSTTQGWTFPNRINGSEQTIVGQNFISTSTTLSSRFPYASSTALSVSGTSYLGTVASGIWNGTAIGGAYGGTGQTSYSVGDTLYASGATTISKLTIGNSGDILTVNGGVPVWLPPSGSAGNWATSSEQYFWSQFRDLSVQGNGYLAPTTTRGLIISASSTISALTSTTGTTTFATSTTFNASTTLSLGGANFSTITNTGNGNLTLTAAGSNQNIVINPSGTGSTQFNSSASFPFNIQTSVAVASLPTGIGIGGTNAGANGSLILWARNNSSAQIQFATNNALVGLFDSNGNFGISTTSPYQKLSVAGDSYTSGTSTASRLGLISSSTPTYSPGTMVYDARCDCMTVYNSDNVVSLQVGQEEWIKVFNNTGSTILNGSAVYTTGSTGVTPTIALANANSAATTIVVGLATEDILNNATGTVTTIGVVNGLNTTGMTAGATVFLSTTTPGGLVPYSGKSPFYRYRVGIVTAVSATVGAIHVTPSTAFIGNGNPFSVLQINSAGNQSFTNELLITGSTTLQNFTGLNSTTTNATTTVLSVSGTANIPSLRNLITNGFVKTSGGIGTLSVDTNTYLTGNQSITLSGAISGAGTTAITTSFVQDPRTWSLFSSTILQPTTTPMGILVNNATSTITNLQSINSTTTQATTTNLYVSGQQVNLSSTFPGVISGIRNLTFGAATTTTWTSTTSGAYIAKAIATFAGTIRTAQCHTDAGFLNVDFYHTSTHLTLLLGASSTVGTVSFSSNNTFTNGEVIYMSAGTTTTSLTTSLACTLGITQTP